jgi:hypothetical protein
MRRHALRLALVLLALPLQACTYWGSHPIPQPGGSEFIVGTARVTRADGAVFFVDNVSVRPDSVTGAVHGVAGARLAFARGEVRSLELKRENSLGAVALALATAAAAMALWGYVMIATAGPDS